MMGYRLESFLEIDLLNPDQECIEHCLRAMSYTYKVPFTLSDTESEKALEAMYFDNEFGIEFNDGEAIYATSMQLEDVVALFLSFLKGESLELNGWEDITSQRSQAVAQSAKMSLKDRVVFTFIVIAILGISGAVAAWYWFYILE